MTGDEKDRRVAEIRYEEKRELNKIIARSLLTAWAQGTPGGGA
jgi:hypothetical protein